MDSWKQVLVVGLLGLAAGPLFRHALPGDFEDLWFLVLAIRTSMAYGTLTKDISIGCRGCRLLIN